MEFLKIVANDIHSKFGENMHDLHLVFPNRRSILFFNKHFSQLITKPVWAPQSTTISDFILANSSFKKADDLQLLFRLYKIYCKVFNSSEPFDNFFYWGELMLSDFDDVDKYLINAEELFKNLSSLKNINELFTYLTEEQIEAIQQFWKNFSVSKESGQKKKFSDIWSALFNIYKELNSELSKEKLAYEGMIYREMAESIFKNSYEIAGINKIAFIGFNALNECEKVLFRHYKSQGKAIFYWDYNEEFINHENHEAGFFIRKNLAEFPSALDNKYFSASSKPEKIEIIAVPSSVGQAKLAGELAEKCTEAELLENTAILLTDENLLMPVLNAIPSKIEDVNITMGYPLKSAPIIALIESIIQLHSSAEKRKNSNSFYYKDLLTVLKHPYVIRDNYAVIKQFEKKILEDNVIYLDYKDLPSGELISLITSPAESSKELIQRLSKIIKAIGTRTFGNQPEIEENPKGIESETLIMVYTAINRFADLISSSDITFDIAFCQRLLKKVLSKLTLPFEGEPLKGLQVMGFLESRAIDFENVIILNVNEGLLPKASIPTSFIPYNLRHGFGLPVMEFIDAMYAYYFYRLLYRTKNLYLLYSTKTEKMGNSEASRYITQLTCSGKFNIIKSSQVFNISPYKANSLVIEKTEVVKKKLEKYKVSKENKSFLSPSAIGLYVDCQLQFYFRYVESLKEYEVPEEEITPSMLGNILHKSMYLLYKPFIGNVVSKKEFETLASDKEKIEKTILYVMKTESGCESNNGAATGRNYIIFRILNKYINQIINLDKHANGLFIKNLESDLHSSISLENGFEVRLGGIIDRVDEKEGQTRILDYKTGTIETKFSNFDELFKPAKGRKAKKEIMQALTYSMIYKEKQANSIPIKPSLFEVKKIFSNDFDTSVYFNKKPINDISEIENEFREKLIEIVNEIFNTNIPFIQTDEIKKCGFCAYSEICHR
jgi:hypothetical protein